MSSEPVDLVEMWYGYRPESLVGIYSRRFLVDDAPSGDQRAILSTELNRSA